MDSVLDYVAVGLAAAMLLAVVVMVFGQRRDRAQRAEWERSQQAEDERLASWAQRLERQQQGLDERAARLDEKEHGAEEARASAASARAAALAERERLASLTSEQARAEVLAHAGELARSDAAALTRGIEADARREGERRARSILSEAMSRVAVELATDSTVVAVPLPGEEFKGRIIGRDGRNIRAFEQVTGANVVVDDTPDQVVLSCFDPTRRERARLTLTDLIADGRIHPARIEEAYARAVQQVDADNLRAAEEALGRAGIAGIDPGFLPAIGALRLRTSYGQNVLAHSVECGQLAAVIAAELGCDVDICRRAAFLHDVGKAETGRAGVTHAAAGADMARRFGEPEDVVHAIAAHHDEVEPRTLETVLVQVADALSASRPGARRESVEAYVQRQQRLEAIAAELPGVERVFAMQAGREVRVMVLPTEVDDAQATTLAREVARRIESELTYAGTIKVTVVRESRAIALAK